MARRIHFPDGTHEDLLFPVGLDYDSVDEQRARMGRVLRERLGDDMANWFNSLAGEIDDRATQVAYDRDDYEADCDNFRGVLSGVQMELVALAESLAAGGKMHRRTIIKALEQQIKVINDTL